MKESYNKKTKLQCITCGDSDFKHDENKSWIKCNRCGKEYKGGYDELVELNQGNIDRDKDFMKKEVKEDLQKDLSEMFRKAFKK